MDRRAITNERMIAWLRNRTPREWHGVACSWNWDQGHEIPLWIVQQGNCDAGTAATLFWLSAPETILDLPEGNANVPAYRADTLAIVREVVDRWTADGYPTRHYSFRETGCRDYPARCVNPDIDLPQDLCEPFDGDMEDDVPGYEEGIPVEVALEVYEIVGERPPEWYLKLNNLQWDGVRYIAVAPPEKPLSYVGQYWSRQLAPENREELLRDKAAFVSEKDYNLFVWDVVITRIIEECLARKAQGLPYKHLLAFEARMVAKNAQDRCWLEDWDRLNAQRETHGILGKVARIFGKR